jgi:acetyltransferase
MSFENLRRIFNPSSVVLVGASEDQGSIGKTLTTNLTQGGFKGQVHLVNPRKNKILGLDAYPGVTKLPEAVDLAIIATPARVVPSIVEECGQRGIRGVIIVSAGFKETGPKGLELEKQITALQEKYEGMRIVGPNCLGVIRPSINLNATFARKTVRPGKVAFISQSGALCTSILDWAVPNNIGFSAFVSIGSMIDVDFGDLIDYFGEDPQTRSIVMYIESITNAKEFMSAARGFARTKPIIVVKSGRFSESAKAAASHTGALAGEDAIYDSALRRSGIVRVDEIEDLFSASETLAMQPVPRGPNLLIVGNAGGPNVMATDALIARGGRLAELNQKSYEALSELLPPFWSRTNPVDILGDASPDRYRNALEICMRDDNADGAVVVYTPQGSSDPIQAAQAVIDATANTGKPVLTSWMGEEDVAEARRLLRRKSIPTFTMPEQAVKAYLYMYQYRRNLELLYETPEELPIDQSPIKHHLKVLARRAASEGHVVLTEDESKGFLESYGIRVVETRAAFTLEEAVAVASSIGYPIVMKILSPQITHKTDVGGVAVGIASDEDLRNRYNEMMDSVRKKAPEARILGVTIQKMVQNVNYELILGCKKDRLFGSVILFGSGGVGVEVFADRAIGLPPLNQVLARRLMERTRIYRVLKDGFRNRKPANMPLLEETVVKFSQMIVDFPEIKELDVNPLVCTDNSVIALDARVILDREVTLSKHDPHQHLVITPYPAKYIITYKTKDGRSVVLRPIRPEDEPMWLEMFENFSEQTIMNRFFQYIKDTPHEMRVRYCNIDYDREMAIVGEIVEDGKRKIVGVVRLVIEPRGKSGEFAVAIADPWQGIGIGSKMVDYIIGIAEDKNLERIDAVVLSRNTRMLGLCRKLGFRLEKENPDEVQVTLYLGRGVEQDGNTFENPDIAQSRNQFELK